MATPDIAILGIIAVSALISLLRGFLREFLSLIGWVLAFWVGIQFAPDIAARLADHVSAPSLRFVLAFVGLFVATLVLASLVAYVVVKLGGKTEFAGVDRMLALVFGIARGAAIVGLLVLLAGLTPLPRDPWWSQSIFIGYFQEIAIWLRSYLPEDMAGYISY
ncbi:MAG: CvpA family protein [Gammaproteobacteria bacterium]|nr:CvpA family protein [Gammaproteobacteria bacterium]MCI0591568.1 CvpA family protein [Gammaproteobacteria bacterium]